MYSLRRSQQAFTLIEVMVVVLIIAAFVGLAVLGLSQASDRPLQAKAQELESWLQSLTDRAVLEGTAYGLQVTEINRRKALTPVVWYRQHWFPVTTPEPFSLDARFDIEFDLPVNDERAEGQPGLVLSGQETEGTLRLLVPDAELEFDFQWQADSGYLALAGGGR